MSRARVLRCEWGLGVGIGGGKLIKRGGLDGRPGPVVTNIAQNAVAAGAVSGKPS